MATNIHVIKVPDVGEGIAEVELVEWHVKPGDIVAEDQTLADVMTDKASVEVPSPVAGRVVSLGGEIGKMLAVGSELIRIDKGGAAVNAAQSAASASVPSPQPVPPASSAAAKPAAAQPAARTSTTPAPPPAVAKPAQAAMAREGSALAAGSNRPIASPAVRRRAWEMGIDLKDVNASGTAGRVMQSDLDAAAPSGTASQPRTADDRTGTDRAAADRTGASAASSARASTASVDDDTVKTIPVIGLRRAIATRMQEAKRRIPHFSYVEELDVTDAEALRSALNDKYAAARGRLTLLPLLMRAVVLAVHDYPQVNAWFDDEAGVVSRHSAVHLGVATQTPNGLMVPVVKHAQRLDLWGMAAEVSHLADAARANRATRDELTGSTITISSLGALGGIVSTPVINRPEVAIIAVNRIVEKPVVRGGAVVVRKTMNLSSSFDHRVVDGDDAARFIQTVRGLIETPGLLFVE